MRFGRREYDTAAVEETAQAVRPELIMSDALRERIAKRAYEFYLDRGCRQGCELEDWVDAEREMLGCPEGWDQRSS